MRTSKPKAEAVSRQLRKAPAQPDALLLFKPQVIALTGVCYSTLYSWMVAGLFPQPVVLGPPNSRTATVAWHTDEVHQWVASRPRRELGTYEFRGRGTADAPETTEPTTPHDLATAMGKALGKKTKPTSPALPKPKPARSRPARSRTSSDNTEFETTTPATQGEAGVP